MPFKWVFVSPNVASSIGHESRLITGNILRTCLPIIGSNVYTLSILRSHKKLTWPKRAIDFPTSI